jgi:hypothetical protein
MQEELSNDIENGKITPRDDFKMRARFLTENMTGTLLMLVKSGVLVLKLPVQTF